MARLIGTELIEKAEVTYPFKMHFIIKELREQVNNLSDILYEMVEIKESEQEMQQQQNAYGFQFDQKNAEFLNKEISFFIDNLRKVRFCLFKE